MKYAAFPLTELKGTSKSANGPVVSNLGDGLMASAYWTDGSCPCPPCSAREFDRREMFTPAWWEPALLIARLPPIETAGSKEEATGMDSGRLSWKILMIAERWVPASTARTEPLAQFVAIDLTKIPVTLSSFGPPPAPFILLVSTHERKHRSKKEKGKCKHHCLKDD